MSRDNDGMFPRGETFYNGATVDANANIHLEGKVKWFEDINIGSAGQGAKPTRSGRMVKCMCVRNSSGIALLPKRLVTLQQSGTFFFGRVDGYARVTATNCFPVDEFLPTAGVPANDLFWIVLEGPCTFLTDLAGGANNNFAYGAQLVSLTAATSGATTAGRAAPIDLTGATKPLADQIMNVLGYALTARTTGNTNADVLVDMRKW